MEPLFYLWAADRQGWITAWGTNTSIAEAAKFLPDEMRKRVATAKDHDQNFLLIPVRVEDIDDLR
jgi:hypothetical protein